MLDERWSEDVEEIGDALRKMLSIESAPERVRKAEASLDGRDPALEAQLEAFGLSELEAPPEMFARIAMELGRTLAATPYVDTIPALALLGRGGVAYGFDGLVAAGVPAVAVRRDDGVYVEPIEGVARRTAAGDYLVQHRSSPAGANTAEHVGDLALADRMSRYASLTAAARMVGAGQALLAYGANYAKEREQFGKLIGSYQGISHRLARASGDLDAAELLVRKAAFVAAPENGGDGAPSEAFAIMVRAKAIETTRFVATNIHQVFGGAGFTMDYDVQLFSRRLRSWAMRGPRAESGLSALGRMVLDPERRDSIGLLWQFEKGMQLPRWAEEADAQ